LDLDYGMGQACRRKVHGQTEIISKPYRQPLVARWVGDARYPARLVLGSLWLTSRIRSASARITRLSLTELHFSHHYGREFSHHIIALVDLASPLSSRITRRN